MFKKILKVVAIVLGAILFIVVAFYIKVYVSTENRMHQEYTVQLEPLSIKDDSATLAYGGRLITTKGCNDCHGTDLGGKVFVNDPALGLLIARNLTSGEGGLAQDYGIEGWTLALKHGLRKDGTPLLFMPSHEYALLSKEDMEAIISYCSQLAPIDRELPESNVGPLGRVLADLGKLPLLPAEMIDHTRQLETNVVAEVSVEYGKYLSAACQGCHRENMKGGEPVAPGFPQVADISSSGNVGEWSTDQFMETLRTGKTPEGKLLNAAEMPWTMTKAYNDVELQALHLYLKSI